MNHILIVDDEAEIRDSLEGILSEEGYLVTTAATAGEASTCSTTQLYDVVLLDIWLPDRDGLDALAEIQQSTPRHPPEVVIISGHGTIEAAVRATKLGAYDFLKSRSPSTAPSSFSRTPSSAAGCAWTTMSSSASSPSAPASPATASP